MFHRYLLLYKMSTKHDADEPEMTEDQYIAQRDEELTLYEKKWDVSRYPHTFTRTHTVNQLRTMYGHLEPGQHLEEPVVTTAGRVISKRASGAKLFFYTIQCSGELLQLMTSQKMYENNAHFIDVNKVLRIGDLVGATGIMGKSKRGELSLFPSKITLLTPCMKFFPKKAVGLRDPVTRVRKRYLDILLNEESRKTFVTRSLMVSFIRKFMEENGFLELPTPVLSAKAGGAIARPFKTHHNELRKDMFMRIAPELFLKQLVIGGFDRVYEVGPQFRNEGIDTTHNPEFWTLEFYAAFTSFPQLISMAEELVSGVAASFLPELTVKFLPLGKEPGEELTINFKPPFARIDIVTELEKQLEVKLPLDNDDRLNALLIEKCDEKGIVCPEPHTTNRLLDRLIGELIEPQCTDPTFLLNHPLAMSPLAKWSEERPLLSERFELFVAGKEISNAYLELNDPRVQLRNFESQAKDKTAGDDEAHVTDHDFVEALEYGLPPTVGFGLGIDRLVMFLTNNCNIRDVIPFPAQGRS